MNTTKYI